ncbi:MAG: hypothetical protein HC902_11090 [Calothrix sp. SM1_5_4]|nr:hypothetical protein [Calothrix sp. SM1_5_4]
MGRLFLVFLLWPLAAWGQLDLQQAKPLKVVGEQEGILQLDLPKEKMRVSPFVLFVRPSGPEFEIIARGKIATVQNDKVLVELDRTSIIKYPLAGDLAVPLGTPKDWPKDSESPILEPPPQTTQPLIPPDPGFIALSYGKVFGKLTSGASDSYTNEYKDIPQYRPSQIHFAWYFEFFWNLGVEYESWSGSFPTSTYYHDYGDSLEDVSIISINYRFRRYWFAERLRPALRLVSINSSFATLNKDEALISSNASAMGAGGRLSFEWLSPVWAPTKGSALRLQQIFLDANFFPTVSVEDQGIIGRGTAGAGSQMYDLKLAVQAIAYVHWIPLIRRYYIEAGYGQRSASYKFAGTTRSEEGGSYTIPENLSARENYQWYYISLGLRFEDYIGLLFKPR